MRRTTLALGWESQLLSDRCSFGKHGSHGMELWRSYRDSASSSSTSKGLRGGSNKATPVRAMLFVGGTLEMASRKPWRSLEKRLALIQFTNLYLGGAYIAAGEKARFSRC
jgi:hypothetical protein